MNHMRTSLTATAFALAFMLPMLPTSQAAIDSTEAKLLLNDNFNSGPLTWITYPDLSAPPSASIVPDPSDSSSTKDNYVLRFTREANARIYHDITPTTASGVITIDFRILKTSSANSAGLWLVNTNGEGVGFHCELNTRQDITRLKVLQTTDSAGTSSLVKALTNLAPAIPPGEKIWHQVHIVWNLDTGNIETTVNDQSAGSTTVSTAAIKSYTRVILQGSFPNSIFMDDIRVAYATR